MQSFYSVVQYVPDVVRNERVNVGVIVFDEHQYDSYFIEDFKRVRSIGGDAQFVKQAAKTIQQLGLNLLKRVVETWDDSIQFTKPAASLLDLTSLVVDASNRFLVEVEDAVSAEAVRTHADLVRLAKQQLVSALRQSIGNVGKKLIKRTFPIRGKFNNHRFDLAVANGDPVHVLDGISFEGPETKHLENKAKAVAWSIDDIRQRGADLPISIAVLPPTSSGHGIYDEAVLAFNGLHARVVKEADMMTWAEDVALQAKVNLPPFSAE